MPQATTKTYQLFRETLLNATSEEHKRKLEEPVITLIEHGLKEYPEGYEHTELKDITLEDVLMALGGEIKINGLGGLSLFKDNKWNDIALPRYYLGKPAHLQSEETLLEIIKLLK